MRESAEPTSTAATVLVVDDILANRNLLRQALEPQGYEVLLAGDGEAALKAAERALPDVILLDVMMPGLDGFETCRRLKEIAATRHIPVLFITAMGETTSMVEGFQAGGIDYITKPFQTAEVLVRVKTHLENARLTKVICEKNQELQAANAQLRAEIERREEAEESFRAADQQLEVLSQLQAERWGLHGLVSRSSQMARVLESVRKLQPLPSTSVLLTGESGTGKELIARAIHFGSPRAKGPFLPVNCSAIPADLAESLLFGYVKGAFSGATADKKGHFENAHGGTLFLDEIGDMPLGLQGKLLRVLETGRVLPLGAAQERAVDVRILAATNAELPAEIAAGKFREDLYFRLARFVLELPPLRQRPEDIAPLTQHLLGLLSTEMGLRDAGIDAAACAALQAYDFPGNVRELRNILERALIESGGGVIQPAHLRFLSEPQAPLQVAVARDGGRTAGSPGPGDRQTSRASTAGGGGSANLTEEERILHFVRERGSINNSECRELLQVGLHRAWYLLRKLHRSNQLIQDNSRRWTHYRLPP
jgi:DNA-binding NtrC family response regulator